MGYNTVTVASTATLIIAANTQRQQLILQNTSDSGTVWIGPDDSITSANAVALYENQTKTNTKEIGYYLGDVYGITHAGKPNADVRYWEVIQ